MSTTDWIAMGTLFTTVIGCLLLIAFRIGAVSSQLNTLGERVSKLEGLFERMNERLNNLVVTVNGHSIRLDQIEKKLESKVGTKD